jgi:WD40 repeat protein/serine/threonine protein kinase
MPATDADRLEEVVNRFEDAWQRGRPLIDEHLAAAGIDPHALLVELAHVDLEKRLKAGEPARVEDYLTRYPQLAGDRAVVLELLRAELALRRRLDAAVSVAEYTRRFPDYRDELLASATASLPNPGQGPTVCLPPDGRRGSPGGSPDETSGGPLATHSRYHVLRVHARGGLGEILAAHDEALQREVALKRLQPRQARDPESRRRFLREAEITGQLEHPGVVPVYGLGQDGDGGPVYAMRLIRGETLQQAIERFHAADRPGRDPGERSLGFRQLLSRFVSVCNTVAYAHSRGVLHRDLKPGNVLLGRYGETLVVDWGLARASAEAAAGYAPGDEPPAAVGRPPTCRQADGSSSDGAHLTQDGAVVGTPAYMSPEQAAGRWDRVGPASDVYSLGATLYVLLTGRPPFPQGQVYEVLDRVRRADFPRPRQIKKGASPALEAACLKAMARRPEDRYGTALALAADLEQWLAGEPVGAWREPLTASAGRWVGRNRTLVTAAAVALVAAAGLAVVTSLWWAATDRERSARAAAAAANQAAEAERKVAELRQRALDQAELQRYYSLVSAADRDYWALRHDQAAAELKECPQTLRGWEWHQQDRRRQDVLRSLQGHDKEVWKVAYSPDGTRLASASLDGTVKVWDPDTGAELLRLAGHDKPVWGVAYSPDGKLLATGGGDGTVRLWDSGTGAAVRVLEVEAGEVAAVAFSPDGTRVAGAVDAGYDEKGHLLKSPANRVAVWEVETGKELNPLAVTDAGLTSLAFSPDGRLVAAGGRDGVVRLWDGGRRETLVPHRDPRDGRTFSVNGVAFSPDGKTLASALSDSTVRVWDVPLRKEVKTLVGHHGAPTWGVAFSPDGTRLATSADDATVRVWDLAEGRWVLVLAGHTRGIANVAYRPDGKALASASDDRSVKVWDAQASRSGRTLLGQGNPVWAVAYRPDGRRFATGGENKSGEEEAVKIWDAAAGRAVKGIKLPASVGAVAYSRDGNRLAAAADDGTVRLYDGDGNGERVLKGHADKVRAVAFSPDGARLASASWDGTVRVWDAATGSELLVLKGHDDKVRAVAFSPDGKTLASAGDDRSVRLWDAEGRELRTFTGHARPVTCLAFSPDGRLLAAGTMGARQVFAYEPGAVTVWDLEKGRPALTLRGHGGDVLGVAYNAADGRLASAGSDWRVKLWGPGGQELVTLDSHVNCVNGVAFSPDGQTLASASCDGTVVLWDGSP